MDTIDITIIGAGVVGLAVATRLARPDREVYVLEKNDSFGRETSSRHSGVIHCGIYYPEGSLKAKLCVAGRHKLYDICEKYGIPYRKLGKLIVATNEDETAELDALLARGQKNGVEAMRMLSHREMKQLEPNIEGAAAIFSPVTGIIDAYALMQYFAGKAQGEGAQIAFHTRVTGIEKMRDGYRLTTEGGEQFSSGLVINCAGLHSDQVAEMAGIDIDQAGYRLRYCKGEYFSVSKAKSHLVKRLVFPVPPQEVTGVGIHVTLDLEGRMRLGPSIEYADRIDYAVDSTHQRLFYDSVRRFLPFIDYDDLEPDMAGIRPKLQGPGEGIRDFVIREESDPGLPGLINLIGIESPGLTASPAIADYVAEIVDKL